MRLPHPIPYQGSKRNLAVQIGPYVPTQIDVWYEPFAGSAAMSIWGAYHRLPRKIVIADSLPPLTELWRRILASPAQTADRYEAIWRGQMDSDTGYFNRVRERFNRDGDPVDLLYLMCRCVKNAIRFNAREQFTQSVDKRRLGTRPEKMRTAIEAVATLLAAKTEVRTGDWLHTTADASPADFIYMDPPYLGTSVGRDRRYAEWMSQDRLIAGLRQMRSKKLRFCLSYDGSSGDRTYGPPLPEALGMTHLSLHCGRSSQATLNGEIAQTYESLYLSHGIGMAASAVRASEDPLFSTQAIAA